MAWFFTRVELHGANEQDYERLHTAMEAKLFRRTIQDMSGSIHKLPTATYFSESPNLSALQVKGLADEAAMTVGRGFMIVTSLATEWAATNLPLA